MTEREERRAARMARGKERAGRGKNPSRRDLEQGAHLVHCDQRHDQADPCNRKLLEVEEGEPT